MLQRARRPQVRGAAPIGRGAEAEARHKQNGNGNWKYPRATAPQACENISEPHLYYKYRVLVSTPGLCALRWIGLRSEVEPLGGRGVLELDHVEFGSEETL
jgi:hypothetical protein